MCENAALQKIAALPHDLRYTEGNSDQALRERS